MKRVRVRRESVSRPLRSSKRLSESLRSGCCICLEAVQQRTIPNKCSHEFCFSCISSWAKIANDCPLCKTKFSSLVKYGLWGVDTIIPVQERKQNKLGSTGVVWTCATCGSPDDPDSLFLCDGPSCQRAFHLYCVNPELSCAPSTPWLCTQCERVIDEYCPDGCVSPSCSRSVGDESDSWDSDSDVKRGKMASKRRRQETVVKNKRARTSLS